MTYRPIRRTIAALATALFISGCASTDPLETGTAGPRGGGKPDGQATSAAVAAVERTPIGDAKGPVSDATAATEAGASTETRSTAESRLGPSAVVASAHGPLKVALLLPLGGFDQTAVISKGMKQAVELALFDSGRSDVQLIVKDDKGTAEGALAAAEEAVKDGAEIILGPLLGRTVPGAASAARASNVPVLTFSNDRTVAGNGVYTLGFSPEQDAERIAEYAGRQGKQRFAAIIPDDTYGSVIGAAFKAAVAKAGGTVVAYETYPAGANAMIGPSRRIVEAARAAEGAGAPIDAVFLPGGPGVLNQLGPLLTYSGFDAGKIKLLGSGAWESATLGSTTAFVGGWYPGPDPAPWREFQANFTKTFGQAPPRVASIAYDAMQIAISLSANAPARQRFTVANLTRPGGYAGVDGTIRLSTEGIAERSLAVHEVQKIGSVIVEAASDAPGRANLDGARFSGAPQRVN